MSKARKSFVIYSMVAVFILLTVLLSVINCVNFTMVAEDADRITEMIAQDKGQFGEQYRNRPMGGGNKEWGRMEFMGPNSPELMDTARYFTFRFTDDGRGEEVAFHVSAYTKEEAKALAKQLLGEKTGWVNTKYRYRVYKNGDYQYVTVVDQGRELLPSYRILIISVIGEIVMLAACFGFLFYVSEKIFKPLEDADRKQRKFLAEAKSEFQIPLTVINANAELLEKEGGSNEYTQTIHRQVKKMITLTKQLDGFAILDDTKSASTCDLSMILQAATDAAARKYDEKGIQVTRDIEEGIIITGEEEALHRVIAELVENSLRYAKTRVGFSLKREEGHIVLMTENDAGLSQRDIEQVFDRFTKLENASGQLGNGLGLSYVKDIVKAHNGRVSAWTENGDFHLRITL